MSRHRSPDTAPRIAGYVRGWIWAGAIAGMLVPPVVLAASSAAPVAHASPSTATPTARATFTPRSLPPLRVTAVSAPKTDATTEAVAPTLAVQVAPEPVEDRPESPVEATETPVGSTEATPAPTEAPSASRPVEPTTEPAPTPVGTTPPTTAPTTTAPPVTEPTVTTPEETPVTEPIETPAIETTTEVVEP